MNKSLLSLAAACGLMLPFASAGFAAPQDYQVTGPILSMTDTTVTVQKGKEQWELSRDATLKPADGSELKVGDKVTVHYTMMAKSVEKKEPAKREKKPPTDKKKADATPAPASATAPMPAAPQKPAAEVSPSPKP